MTEDQNTIMELRARIQELQNEGNCMNDSRDFKDAESVRSGPSHVPSQPALLPPYRDPGGLLTRMVYRETFLQIHERLLRHLIQEGSSRGFPMCQNTYHRM